MVEVRRRFHSPLMNLPLISGQLRSRRTGQTSLFDQMKKLRCKRVSANRPAAVWLFETKWSLNYKIIHNNTGVKDTNVHGGCPCPHLDHQIKCVQCQRAFMGTRLKILMSHGSAVRPLHSASSMKLTSVTEIRSGQQGRTSFGFSAGLFSSAAALGHCDLDDFKQDVRQSMSTLVLETQQNFNTYKIIAWGYYAFLTCTMVP